MITALVSFALGVLVGAFGLAYVYEKRLEEAEEARTPISS